MKTTEYEKILYFDGCGQVCPSSEFLLDFSGDRCQCSDLVQALCTSDPPHTLRFLSSATRGPDMLLPGLFVVISVLSQPARVGRLDEMVEMSHLDSYSSVIRLWLGASRLLKRKADDTMWSPHASDKEPSKPLLVSFECVQVDIVVISRRGPSHDEFM